MADMETPNLCSDETEYQSKKVKLGATESNPVAPVILERKKGEAPVKKEYRISASQQGNTAGKPDDDASEAVDARDKVIDRGPRREKSKGQNKARNFGCFREARQLCQSRALSSEFSAGDCPFGDTCRYEHDLRHYLDALKRTDLTTFNGKCPIWEQKGKCGAGWKCRFVGSHTTERETDDGRKELVLVEESRDGVADGHDDRPDVVNVITRQVKSDLMKKKINTPKTDVYLKWLENPDQKAQQDQRLRIKDEDEDSKLTNQQENRAQYREPPFLPSEKRRLYFGPDTPVLAPLTTQGNLPFRRLCVSLGAQLTYSEMAMSQPLVQGHKPEWALLKAHRDETLPPNLKDHSGPVVEQYDPSKDLKFGAQIAGNKPYMPMKATEYLTKLCPSLRVIDLNCGCPIDLVYRQGAGSALMDNPSKLEKILKGMNAVSDEIPVTTKIRMGTKDGKPTASKLVNRLVYGNSEVPEDIRETCGVAALTLHGRSRQQRYSRSADWDYISSCAALINRHRDQGDDLSDTVREVDSRQKPASGKVFFIGNGDCYSHVDYNDHISNANVDAVMVARGALVKPWVFEEIEKGQYLDKSASERLSLVERFVRFGLDAWGSDELGVSTTRRFLLEWLSFAYRYVPIGILEHLPPSLQDRPPTWRGRSDLETLLGSDNYKDWIKISEMFLGPTPESFNFRPKHKSNSYEIQAEG